MKTKLAMIQIDDFGDSKIRGYAAGPYFDCHVLSIDAFGETHEDSGLTLFAYCWRRFGPPWCGSDNYKELVNYYLTTRIDGMFLRVSCKAMELEYCFGVAWDDRIQSQLPDWPPEDDGASLPIVSECKAALVEAMRELLRPVRVRDVSINCLGRCEHAEEGEEAEVSRYAGFGVDKEAMDKNARAG